MDNGVITKQPMARLKVSPGGLYTLLNAELRNRRKVECSCRMPLPYQVAAPDDVSANWRIGTPKACGNGCDVLIAEIVAAMWPRYDLMDTATEKPPEQQGTQE